jgi:hypothetical protein
MNMDYQDAYEWAAKHEPKLFRKTLSGLSDHSISQICLAMVSQTEIPEYVCDTVFERINLARLESMQEALERLRDEAAENSWNNKSADEEAKHFDDIERARACK